MRVNEILLRRKSLIFVEDCDITVNNEFKMPKAISKEFIEAATVVSNVSALGYSFSDSTFNLLVEMARNNKLAEFADLLIDQLKVLVGADVKYVPMYRGFPEEVMEKSDAELLINALIHYWTCGEYMPLSEDRERMPLKFSQDYKVLDVGSKEDLMSIFTNLLSSKTSISNIDCKDIATIIDKYNLYDHYLPEDIPFKENVALVAREVFYKTSSIEPVQKYFKTATDILRFAIALSHDDISMAEIHHFKKFKRSERRMILYLMNIVHISEPDLYKYREVWIRLGEVIHPGEYRDRYPKAYALFTKLREERSTSSDSVEYLLAEYSMQTDFIKRRYLLSRILVNLVRRPGEFARRLDYLLRIDLNMETVYIIEDAFREIADQVSIPVLIQVYTHFKYRCEKDKYRIVFPKGRMANAYMLPVVHEPLPSSICSKICIICKSAIITILSQKPSLGKVYIDPLFNGIIIPFSQRSATKETYTRGSRFPIGNSLNVVRPFIWWTNGECDGVYHSRVDLDLSVCYYNADWQKAGSVSYMNLKDASLRSYHSGDIVNGGPVDGDGAAEFIDIDIDSALAVGVRYAVIIVNSFSGEHFSILSNAKFGWMLREDINSGEIFEPKTVDVNINLVSDATCVIPAIIDLKSREIIWCDMTSLVARGLPNNVEVNNSSIINTCYAITNMRKMSLYELCELNALSRGGIVESREEADVIFSNNRTKPLDADGNEKDITIITSFDVDYIVGNLM